MSRCSKTTKKRRVKLTLVSDYTPSKPTNSTLSVEEQVYDIGLKQTNAIFQELQIQDPETLCDTLKQILHKFKDTTLLKIHGILHMLEPDIYEACMRHPELRVAEDIHVRPNITEMINDFIDVDADNGNIKKFYETLIFTRSSYVVQVGGENITVTYSGAYSFENIKVASDLCNLKVGMIVSLINEKTDEKSYGKLVRIDTKAVDKAYEIWQKHKIKLEHLVDKWLEKKFKKDDNKDDNKDNNKDKMEVDFLSGLKQCTKKQEEWDERNLKKLCEINMWEKIHDDNLVETRFKRFQAGFNSALSELKEFKRLGKSDNMSRLKERLVDNITERCPLEASLIWRKVKQFTKFKINSHTWKTWWWVDHSDNTECKDCLVRTLLNNREWVSNNTFINCFWQGGVLWCRTWWKRSKTILSS